jgi:hypothetical protein
VRKYIELVNYTKSVYDVDADDGEDPADVESMHSEDTNTAEVSEYGSSAHSVSTPMSSSHSAGGNDNEDPLTDAMSSDIVDQKHLKQRRASLTMYIQAKVSNQAAPVPETS